jgi:hypothetical protein
LHCAFCKSVVVGLRWGYAIAELRYVLPVLAACLPPLVYAGFRGMIHDRTTSGLGYLIYAAPVLATSR